MEIGEWKSGGLSALLIAVRERSTKFVTKILTVPDIMIDQKTQFGETPLSEAVHWGFVKIMNMLLKAGADIHARNMYGNMPIHKAVTSGRLGALKSLVKVIEDLDVGGYNMCTPLILAVKAQNYDIAQYLVDMGADVDIHDNDNMTAMDYAVAMADGKMEKILKQGSE